MELRACYYPYMSLPFHRGVEDIICRGCGTLLARIKRESPTITRISLLKTRHGESVYVDVVVGHMRGGAISIDCEKCKDRIGTAYYCQTLVLDDEQVRLLREGQKKSMIQG